MSDQTTIAELIDLAIAAEEAAEKLYLGFETRFAHHTPVARSWQKYALEEAGHTHWLERLRERASPEQLATLAEPRIVRDARLALQRSVDDLLQTVGTLEDAYQLAHEFEHAETNIVFEFLISSFAEDRNTRMFLRAQLREHVAKLMIGFPQEFQNSAIRQEIMALG